MYKDYINDVLNGKIVSCELVKLAVKRHVKDLDRQNTNDFPFYFDEQAANKAIRFFQCLRHTKGEWAGKKFNLSQAQAFRIASLFGWKKESGHRRFTRAYIEVARKGGKTEEAAGMMLYGMTEPEGGAEVYSAATTKDQAKLSFRAAQIMARNAKKDGYKWAKNYKLYSHHLTKDDSICKALSADANTLDGLNPHIAIIDEFHAHPTREVLDVMETGVGARRQPLIYIITTAGFSQERPAYQLRKVMVDILNGNKIDENFFGIIYTLDEGDSWEDESRWIKANPNIGVTPSWDFMRSQCQKAKNEGAYKMTEFLTKNLNVWTNQFTAWIPNEQWTALKREIDVEGRECYVGLDLASTSDYNAAAFFYPDPNGSNHYMSFMYWINEAQADKRGFDLPAVKDWIYNKHVTVTEGNVIDYDVIAADLLRQNAKHRFTKLAFDRAFSASTIPELHAQGLPLEPFSQSIMHVSAPTKEFERMILSGEMSHDGNPCTAWMLGNVAIFQDGNGNIRVHKGKSNEKVDGIAAAVMAVGQWMNDRLESKAGSYLFDDDNDILFR